MAMTINTNRRNKMEQTKRSPSGCLSRHPDNLWAIWIMPTESCQGFFAPPNDDDGTEILMCWPTREQAAIGLAHQIEMGYYEEGDCEIAQVK